LHAGFPHRVGIPGALCGRFPVGTVSSSPSGDPGLSFGPAMKPSSDVEADSMEPFGQIRMDWGDMFEIEVVPVVTAEQGLQMARQAMASGQG
jgi:hypothetical protein